MVPWVSRIIQRAAIDTLCLKLLRGVVRVKEAYHDRVKTAYYESEIKQTAASVGENLWVGGASSVNERTVLGDNVNLLGLTVRGAGALTIGDNFHAGSGCEIITAYHNYDNGDAIPYDDTYVREPVHIGDNVWFGINVTVLSGVSIGEGAIIQADSVVTDDIPPGAIAGGHPAEVFAHRDMDHYKELKAADRVN